MIYFQSFKGRGLAPARRVKLYRNLNMKPTTHVITGRVMPWYSVKDAETGLVLGHTQQMLLSNVTFEVSEKGRQKVLDTGRKNVHAYVVGNWTGQSWWTPDYENFQGTSYRLSYNPRVGPNFTTLAGTAVAGASLALASPEGVFASNLITKES